MLNRTPSDMANSSKVTSNSHNNKHNSKDKLNVALVRREAGVAVEAVVAETKTPPRKTKPRLPQLTVGD